MLACPECSRVVVVTYRPAHVEQGLTNLDEHRVCYRCGGQMVETGRDEFGRVTCPQPSPRSAKRRAAS